MGYHSGKRTNGNKVNYKFMLFACSLFLISIMARMIYSTALESIITYPDSREYLRAAANLVNLKIDIIRVPVYPLMIQFAHLIFPGFGMENSVVILQVLISSFTAVLIFYLSLILFDSYLKAFIAALYCSISIGLINWDFFVLSESLTVFLIALIALMLVLYVRKGRRIYIISMYFICGTLVFTKPFYIPLPVIIFIILLVYGIKTSRKREILSCGITALILIYTSIGVYSYINLRQNGYFGISNVGAINSLGKVLQYNMYELGDNTVIINRIKAEVEQNGGEVPEPADFIYGNKYNENNFKEISSFTEGIIRRNPVLFIQQTVELAARNMTRWNISDDYNKNNYKTLWPWKVNKVIDSIPGIDTFAFVFIMLIVELSVLIYRIIRKMDYDWAWLLLTSLVGFQYIMSIAGSYAEYSRLVVPVYDFVILMFFKYLIGIFQIAKTMALTSGEQEETTA